jgi:hypothetical protein
LHPIAKEMTKQLVGKNKLELIVGYMQKPFPLKHKAFGHVELLYTKGLET